MKWSVCKKSTQPDWPGVFWKQNKRNPLSKVIFKEVISLRMNLLSVTHFLHQNCILTQYKKASLQCSVLITGESNFDERNLQLIRGSLLKK